MYTTKQEVQTWLNKHWIRYATIYEDLTVDVNESVSINGEDIGELPIQFGVVSGFFRCERAKLTSLKGSPRKVGRGFMVQHNLLKSLIGGPLEIAEDFNCSHNLLDNLIGGPQTVGRSYNCEFNQLTSLEGGPRILTVNLKLSENQLSSLKGTIEEVKGRIHCDKNPLQSLVGAPRMRGFSSYHNELKNLDGFDWSQIETQFQSEHIDSLKITGLEPYYTHKEGREALDLRGEKLQALKTRYLLEQQIHSLPALETGRGYKNKI